MLVAILAAIVVSVLIAAGWERGARDEAAAPALRTETEGEFVTRVLAEHAARLAAFEARAAR